MPLPPIALKPTAVASSPDKNKAGYEARILSEKLKMAVSQRKLDDKVKLVGPIAMEDQMRFAIREGGRTVGAGVVTKILA